MKYIIFIAALLLTACGSTPPQPSANVRASCPSPTVAQSAIKDWYRICRDAAMEEHILQRKKIFQ